MYVRIGRLHFKIGRDGVSVISSDHFIIADTKIGRGILKVLFLELLLIIINYLEIFSEACLSLLGTMPESIILFTSKVMCGVDSFYLCQFRMLIFQAIIS